MAGKSFYEWLMKQEVAARTATLEGPIEDNASNMIRWRVFRELCDKIQSSVVLSEKDEAVFKEQIENRIKDEVVLLGQEMDISKEKSELKDELDDILEEINKFVS